MEFDKELKFAKNVIMKAGSLSLSLLQKNLQTKLKKDGSTITFSDKAIENFIKKQLKEKFQGYGFIGEETPFDQKEISWIIDPIDGTIAYSRMIPEFGITISLKRENEIIFAVMYLPNTSDLYFAYKNQGAYKNNDPIYVSKIKEYKKALFSIGMQNFWISRYQNYTLSLIKNGRFRVGHSAVVESCYLASGKTDVLIKFEQQLWDTAGEYLLMKEAGAIITDATGSPLQIKESPMHKYNYIATNKYISKNLSNLYM